VTSRLTLTGQPAAAVTYRRTMGRLILILLAVLAIFVVISMVISALHFLFWVALIALILVGVFRLGGVMRRSNR
jgi:uncharacterized integral membrane protein